MFELLQEFARTRCATGSLSVLPMDVTVQLAGVHQAGERFLPPRDSFTSAR
jgi:hypothetical protein